MAASLAAEVDEAVLEDSASSIFVELANDEARQAALRFGALEEGGPVLLYHLVEERLFRASSLVAIGSCGPGKACARHPRFAERR